MIGLDGYTISTGIVSDDLDPSIVAVPLEVDERIEITAAAVQERLGQIVENRDLSEYIL